MYNRRDITQGTTTNLHIFISRWWWWGGSGGWWRWWWWWWWWWWMVVVVVAVVVVVLLVVVVVVVVVVGWWWWWGGGGVVGGGGDGGGGGGGGGGSGGVGGGGVSMIYQWLSQTSLFYRHLWTLKWNVDFILIQRCRGITWNHVCCCKDSPADNCQLETPNYLV